MVINLTIYSILYTVTNQLTERSMKMTHFVYSGLQLVGVVCSIFAFIYCLIILTIAVVKITKKIIMLKNSHKKLVYDLSQIIEQYKSTVDKLSEDVMVTSSQARAGSELAHSIAATIIEYANNHKDMTAGEIVKQLQVHLRVYKDKAYPKKSEEQDK